MERVHYTEIFSKEDLDEALEKKLVTRRKHPELDLWIYNYSATAVFDWQWGNVTTNCRGLVLDKYGYVIARPFKKFFSYEQLDGKLPEGHYKVLEKLDGSLLQVFTYENKLITATRGSFESDQAKKAWDFLTPEHVGLDENDNRYDPVYGYRFDPQLNYVFEILYKNNKIVVDYDFEGLVLLGVFDVTGMEYDSAFFPFRRPKVYSFNSLEEILECNESNIEGFILKFHDDLVKVKTDDYKKLHRLLTGLNEKTIWEALSEGTFDKLLEDAPDEMHDFIKKVQYELQDKYDEIRMEVLKNMKDFGSRKENALYYQTQKYPGLMFNILDGKDISEGIWKMCRPKVTQTFKVVGEDTN